MSEHKYIQPQRYITSLQKREAIERVREYVEDNLEEFRDGEVVSIDYKGDGDQKDETFTTSAVVRLTDSGVTIETLVTDRDTMKVIESEAEPDDKKALWLTDSDDGGEEDDFTNLREEVKVLKETIRTLKSLVNKHEYALNNTLAGGDIIENSEKFDEENSDVPEEPDDAEGIIVYGDGPVAEFDLYIGNLPLNDIAYTDYENTILYRNKRYPLRLRMFNEANERVEETEDYELTLSYLGNAVYIDERRVIETWGDDDPQEVQVGARLLGASGETLTKTYTIYFKKNEEPDYDSYAEPNVHHILQKSAKDFQTMLQYGDYLCVGEMCWCEKEEALFLKAKGANGTIRYFKINGTGGGGGGDVPTGDTETITYRVEDGVLYAISSDDSISVVDGTLTLVGEVDANGVLRLIDQ